MEFIRSFRNPSVGLDTWGVDPLDYRLSDNLHLLRRYPSPLTHFGLSQRQKKVITEKVSSRENFFSSAVYRRSSFIHYRNSSDQY